MDENRYQLMHFSRGDSYMYDKLSSRGHCTTVNTVNQESLEAESHWRYKE